ncbi:hypothetical protein F1728_19080 [Gimesia benthica]|uniref:Uncharacterized protein n=1 Tax=Gimesia benthica TaxID=2608982 RepID=A0A6I6AGI8_9PLAN|nr:hypothetical protein [Gimesia benthica]QGQ24662.1 hypothetical protein F1728_19080 [Gimesia benthica]
MIRLAILLSLVMFVCITKIAFCAPDVKDEVKYKEPKPSSWVEITSRERLISVLELIGHQTRGNYEKIHTWQGTCNEINQSTLSISTLRQLGYSKLTFPISVSFTAKHNFRIDLINNKIYSDYENGNAEFVNETDGKIVDVPFKREDSEKNIVTQEHYLSYSPNSPYLNPFRTKIKTKTLPTAFRKDTRLAMFSLFSNSIDPRILMGPSAHHQFAYEMNGWADDIRKNKLPKSFLRIDEAKVEGETWFRVTNLYPDTGLKSRELIFYSAYGFNNSRLSDWSPGRKKNDEPHIIRNVRYTKVDGIFVPSEAVIQRGTNHRTLQFGDCSLNEPIKPAWFTLDGLALADGGLYMDDIEKVAYVNKSGSLEKLADYGIKNNSSFKNIVKAENNTNFPKYQFTLIAINILALLCILIGLWVRKRKTNN